MWDYRSSILTKEKTWGDNSRDSSNVLKFLLNIWYIQFQSQIVYLPYIYLFFPQNLKKEIGQIYHFYCCLYKPFNAVYCLFHNDLKHHLANIYSFRFRCHLLKHSDSFPWISCNLQFYFFFWLLLHWLFWNSKKKLILLFN